MASRKDFYFMLNRLQMRCAQAEHEEQRLKYVCVDSACTAANKVGCADCFLEVHSAHKRVPVEAFVDALKNKLALFEANLESAQADAHHGTFLSDLGAEVDRDIEEIKLTVTRKLDELSAQFKQHAAAKVHAACSAGETLDRGIAELDQIKAVAVQNFDSLAEKDIASCLSFYFCDSRGFKGVEETRERVARVRASVVKNKQKYLERVRSLCQELMDSDQHADEAANGGASDDAAGATPVKGANHMHPHFSNLRRKRSHPAKHVTFATDAPQAETTHAADQTPPKPYNHSSSSHSHEEIMKRKKLNPEDEDAEITAMLAL